MKSPFSNDGSSPGQLSPELIADQLTEAVHEHRVLPGMKLSEDEVGEVFGVRHQATGADP